MASPPSKRARLSPSAPSSPSSSQIAAEIAVGISEYVNPTLPSWSGVLKQRYTDFLVNEVGPSGEVLHFRSARAPGAEEAEEEGKAKKRDERTNAPKPAAEEKFEVRNYKLPRQIEGRIDKFADVRSVFHALIRTLFGSRLDTETASSDPPQIVVKRTTPEMVAGQRRRSKRGGKNHKRQSWKELGGEYCHFTLYKENRDTMEVLNLIGRLIRVNGGNKAFSFAGTKDKRAVTVQRCAAHMVRAERLAGLNKAGDGGLRGARLGDFEYKPYGLSLGDLRGNEFVITLRQAESLQDGVSLEDAVKTCVEAVKRSGFANYYGLQRFGSFEVTTSDVGAYLLRSDWRGAIEKILSYNPALIGTDESDKVSKDDRERAEACEIFLATYDIDLASSKMPRKFVAENSVLRFFREHGMKGDGKGNGLDYLGALQSVPRNLRIMYAHAYQSLVWNHVASARLRMSRTEVIPGDLVYVEQEQKQAVEEIDQDGEIVIAADSADAHEDKIKRARPLTAEEAASGKYTIFDVVLPTPGWDIVYPTNPELVAVYKEVMEKDGLDLTNMKRGVREYSLPGSYRKLMAGFIDGECSYEVRQCKLGEQVVTTDLEKRKRQDEQDETNEGSEEQETVVVLRMRLGTSCYATMALRELLKGGVRAFQPEFIR
ncbi:pseudouridine synthase [Sphaerosporella brunnea]|uniref:Pseudouridine synthase n=1 Tax=Sphaerosporella brunnea TaxID=1250544 RepID=A0A5J5EB06_9PEZI|nr:pseudouridine synthase [Sphaerosporella brunnea]